MCADVDMVRTHLLSLLRHFQKRNETSGEYFCTGDGWKSGETWGTIGCSPGTGPNHTVSLEITPVTGVMSGATDDVERDRMVDIVGRAALFARFAVVGVLVARDIIETAEVIEFMLCWDG